ncbi:MAG: hypothetical protein WB783_01830 [Arenicellales bacterium]
MTIDAGPFDGQRNTSVNQLLYHQENDKMSSQTAMQGTGAVLLAVFLVGATAGCASTGLFGQAPQVLTDSSGMTLYRFDKDEPGSGKSACYGTCAAAWPPAPATQINGDEFGSLSRTDGTPQLTYEGWPLYTYSGDAKPGDTKGDNIRGIWHAVRSEQMSRSNGQSDTIGGGGY